MTLNRSLRCGLAGGLLALTFTPVGFSAGVTVITHGWQPSPTFPLVWMENMADAVTNQAWAHSIPMARYRITLHVSSLPSVLHVAGPLPDDSNSAEVIITLNWSEVAGHRDTPGFRADVVASELLPFLALPNQVTGFARRLAELPIHVVGHSRGGSAMADLARQLGALGIWVEHLTALDPHPLTSPDYGVYPACNPFGASCALPDPPMRIYDHVVFADNYWRRDARWTGWSPTALADFNGEPVAAVADYPLKDSVFTGEGYFLAHSDVHLWYFGTIGGPYSVGNGEATIGANWYFPPHPPAQEAGCAFARSAGHIEKRVGTGATSWLHDGSAAPRFPNTPNGSQ